MRNRQNRRSEPRSMSQGARLAGFIVVVAAAFFVGVYSSQIVAFVSPVFGIKTYAGSLDVSSLQETYRNLKANFDGELDDQKLVEGANRGLVAAAGDEYTIYMNASESEEFDNSLSGTIGGGVGVELAMRSERLTVVRVLKDNPAERAGLSVNDVIIAINDEPIGDQSVSEAVTKIRGEVGTTVKLTIDRSGDEREFTLTREEINNQSVYSSVSDGVGVMTVTRFDSETGALARTAAQEFKNQGVKAVVLDLRGNGGGYITAAQDLASLWLNQKVVVSERVNGKTTDELRTGSNPILGGIPTVVLVNASSASASEIVAGALQDNGAATLMGETTFGKGSVQKLISLPGGAELKVTVARWFTPNGVNISEKGIEVDTSVSITAEDIAAGRDPQLDAAKAALR